VPTHSDPVHSDPEELALRALGEEVSAGTEEHLAICAHCRSELDQLRAVVASGRAIRPEDYPTTPPQRVWDGIVAELGLTTGAGSGGGEVAGQHAAAEVDDLARRRAARATGARFGVLAMAAAAVAGIILGAGTVALLTGDDEPPGTVVATADLEPLPDRRGTGVAEIRGTGADRSLVVDVSGLTRNRSGFYEVWLLDKDAQRLVSLGVLRGDTGTYPLPPSVDVSEYPVVDVSIEPVDGDPAHSGDSVVRGVLSG